MLLDYMLSFDATSLAAYVDRALSASQWFSITVLVPRPLCTLITTFCNGFARALFDSYGGGPEAAFIQLLHVCVSTNAVLQLCYLALSRSIGCPCRNDNELPRTCI